MEQGANLRAVSDKHEKYAPLLNIARLQHLRKERRSTPRFFAVATSHSGEMAGDVFDLVEWMTGQYRHAARKGGQAYCGKKPSVMAAEFRRRLKDGIQAITARAIGSIMVSAGYYSK